MTKTGLLFGSFNPVHTGHLIIAEYFVSSGLCDHVELVVSPQNPLKNIRHLAPENDRLAMARLAVRGNPHVSVNAIEFTLPRPSYTSYTLSRLAARHPEQRYQLILGSDSLERFHEWKDWEQILHDYRLCVYRRPGYDGFSIGSHPHVRVFDKVPQLYISATYIREQVRRGKSIRYLVPEPVRRYISQHDLFV